MAIGIVLGFINSGKTNDVRTRTNESVENIQNIIADIDKVTDDHKDFLEKIHSFEEELAVVRESVDSTNRKAKSIDAQLASKDQEIKQAKLRLAEIDATLAPYAGLTPENLRDKIEEMNDEISEKNEESDQLQKEIEVIAASVDRDNEALVSYRKDQSSRSATIRLNSLQATITAVNNDWGFVVINAGSRKGVSQKSRLLIKRGNENIGRLNVVSIKPNTVIANIDQKSLRAGNLVTPGDQVIFEPSAN